MMSAAGNSGGDGTGAARAAPRLVLYDWAVSPFSLKVRAALDHKGLAYVRVPIVRRANRLSVRRRGGVGKAPALEIDGRLHVDSTDICHEIERRFPDPPILPAAARERALCHAIEEWADESLYFIGLYYHWHDPEGRARVPEAFPRGLGGRLLFRFFLRRVLGQLRGQGTARKSPEHVRSDLARHLDALDALFADRPFALGDRPYLCDFALFGQLVYLGRSPVGGRSLAGRTAIEGFVSRMKARRPAAP